MVRSTDRVVLMSGKMRNDSAARGVSEVNSERDDDRRLECDACSASKRCSVFQTRCFLFVLDETRVMVVRNACTLTYLDDYESINRIRIRSFFVDFKRETYLYFHFINFSNLD